MKRFLIGVFALLLTATSSHATYIYESATGPFETSISGGYVVNESQFFGAQFTLEQDTLVTGIGGFFDNFFQTEIFGALVDLNGATLWPPMSQADIMDRLLAHTLFTPERMKDSLGSVSQHLKAGEYGVFFGTGLFGTSGMASLLTVDYADLMSHAGQQLYTQPGTAGLKFYALGRPNYRVLVEGTPSAAPVPEPGTLALSLIGLIGLAGVRRFRRSN